MSNLKVNTINDASGGSNAVLYGVAAPANSMGFRNRIINGDMRIDQRNAGASVTQTTALLYPVDRFAINGSVTSKFSAQRSTTVPTGFDNSLLLTSLSAYSVGTSEYFLMRQTIEGFNVADLDWGKASAQAITISFKVRSSITGTFGGSLLGGGGRCYVFLYTISSANTWEDKTILISGDTSGTWAKDNTAGIYLDFSVGAGATFQSTAGVWGSTTYRAPTGQTSLVGTSGATFYITGVQLEAGSVASPFEARDYGRELMMCQRYCVLLGGSDGASHVGAGVWYASTAAIYQMRLPVEMRAAPVLTNVSPNLSMYYSGATASATAPTINTASKSAVEFYTPVTSGSVTAGQGTSVRYLSGKSLLTAEL